MNGIARLGDRAARIAHAVVPDPFVIAILLGLVALLASIAAGGRSPAELVSIYATGMLSTKDGALPFAFQMALVLVTGHALAEAPSIRAGLSRLAAAPRSAGGAAGVVALASMLLGLLNWGLGLVGGALLAREVGRAFRRRGAPLNYPLVGAAGYLGLLVWHGGLSGSAPLKVATSGSFGPAIDVRETLFSPANLAITLALLVALPLLFRALGAGQPSPRLPPAEDAPAAPVPDGRGGGLPARLERSWQVTACLSLPIAAALALEVAERGTGAVSLNAVILLFWAIGLALHRTPAAYARAFADGSRGAAGILLQFPIYFGILAVAQESGLVESIARGTSSLVAYLDGVLPPGRGAPLVTWLSAAALNLFVPSGGGQWAIQSPVILETCRTIPVERAPMVLAFAYGDELTNMLQPFWALPLLSITGLAARDILGYTLLAMLAAAPIFAAGLLLL